jgi:hypothetical protein
MKLKIIMLLIIISLKLISGVDFCEGQPFKNIMTKSSFFHKVEYLKKGDIDELDGFSTLENLPIKSLTPDWLVLEFNEEEIKLPIFSSNLFCNQLNDATNLCLLEVVTITSNLYVFKQIKFQYEYKKEDSQSTDCEELLREGLGFDDKAKEKKFCQIRNINKFDHIFTVPLLAKGEEKAKDIMKFNTEDKLLRLNNSVTWQEEAKIKTKTKITKFKIKKSVELTIEGRLSEFDENDSCFYLLKKIKSYFPEKCPEGTYEFKYHYLTKSEELVTKEEGIPPNGVIKLKDLDNIIVNGHSEFKFKHFNDARHLPYYEDNFLNVYLTRNGDNYEAYVSFRSEECLKRMRDKLLSLHSCSYDDGNNSLVYYALDLQNKMVGRVLGFFLDSGYVKVYYTLEDIIIHDIKLKEDVNSKQERLYIKGVRKGNQQHIIEREYLVNIKNNSVCQGKFDKIRGEVFSRYVGLAEKGIFYFLQEKKSKNKKAPAVAVVKLEKSKISINDQNMLIQDVKVKEKGNSLILAMYGEEIIYHNGCEDCFRIFTEKLKIIAGKGKKEKPKHQPEGDSEDVEKGGLEKQPEEEKPKHQPEGDSEDVEKGDLEKQPEEEMPKHRPEEDSKEKKISKNTNENSKVRKEGKHKEKEHPKPNHKGVSKVENKVKQGNQDQEKEHHPKPHPRGAYKAQNKTNEENTSINKKNQIIDFKGDTMKAKDAKQILEQEYQRPLLAKGESNVIAKEGVKENENTIQLESEEAHSFKAEVKNDQTKKRFFHLTKPNWTIIREGKVEYI